jgi:micrococcal nuclease
MIAIVSAADRAGLFGYQGDDHARFDQRRASVIEVIDGDTVRIADDDGPPLPARLLGIDAPELPDAHWAPKAHAYTAARLKDRTVTLRLDPLQTRDADGRLLAYLFITDGDCLNVDLARDGQAYADRRLSHSLRTLIESAETEARRKGRGLWKDVTESQMPAWRQAWLEELQRRRRAP